jgi:hypothetical protein
MILKRTLGSARQPCRTALPALVLAVLAVSFSTAGEAAGETTTRADYVPRAEAICHTATVHHQTVLRGVAGMVHHHELSAAAARLRTASRVLGHVITRLAAIPRPPADQKRLARWFSYGRSGDHLLQRMARRLADGSSAGVSVMANDLLRDVRRANATVVGFEFHYCRIDPANFT